MDAQDIVITNSIFNMNTSSSSPQNLAHVVLISVIAATISGFFAGGIAFSYLGDRAESDIQSGQVSQVDVSQEESAVTKLVQEVSPSVVSISISKEIAVGGLSPFDILRGQDGRIETREREVGGGTGFVVSEDGFIMTNRHVVRDENATYTVIFNDGEQIEGKVIALHPTQDLAIVKIDKSGLKPLSFAESDSILVGQTVVAIGNALSEFDNSLSRGVVSGLRRSIVASDQEGNSEALSNIIQTDAAINPGNSGGPLLDINGKVIGVNVATAQGAQSIGFAIPSNVAIRMIEDVKEFGEVKISYLGVRYQMIQPKSELAEELKVEQGVFISASDGVAVLIDSPADKAGLQSGDILTKIDNEELTTRNALVQVLSKYRPGEEITVELLRDGATQELQLVLGERPQL